MTESKLCAAPTEPDSPAAGRAGAGIHILPEPSPTVTALITDLLWPATSVVTWRRDEVRDRLVQVIRPLLSARHAWVLQWGPADYTVVRDDAGSHDDTPTAIEPQASPLPLLTSQCAGVLIENPDDDKQADVSLGRLLGHAPAVLLPLPSNCERVDVLALSLEAIPSAGELALALALVRGADAALSRQPGQPATGAWPPANSRGALDRDVFPLPTSTTQPLSPREREVVQLVAAGLPNKQIARRLNISEKTVKFHLGHIFEKLSAGSRAEVLLRVIAAGLLVPEVTDAEERGGPTDDMSES